MEQGRIVAWLKSEGESFTIGDLLYEVESEKASVEVEAKVAGTLLRIFAPVGSLVSVGAIIALVAELGEAPPKAEVDAALVAMSAAADPAIASALPANALQPSEQGERSYPVAMPNARRMAAKAGIDLRSVVGTGPDGAVTAADVLKVTERGHSPAVRENRTLNSVHLAMAATVIAGWAIPQFVQTVLSDATRIDEWRERDKGRFTYTDYLIRAIVAAAVAVPEVNSTFAGDTLTLYEDVNVAVATISRRGLLLPVLRRVQLMDLTELARNRHELIERARSGLLEFADMEEATITLSNLGRYPLDGGTPILTPGQSALVFVGALRERPMIVAGEVRARKTLPISIAFDHRAVDGVTAAKFTAALLSHLQGDAGEEGVAGGTAPDGD
jgi:pyruvate dehydrogenase E2 component (dihydrolipoamide acetyltransferase)